MKATVVLQPPTRTKEEEELLVVGGGSVHECIKEAVSGLIHSNLDLRLGMPVGSGGGDLLQLIDHQHSKSDAGGSGGPQKRRCFAAGEAAGASGFVVDPWSLAARQETAFLEQATKQPQASSMTSRSINPPPPPPSTPAVVGWPPVRSFRRNLGVLPQQQTKSEEKPKKEEPVPVQVVEEAKLQMENTMDDMDNGVVNNSSNYNKSESNSNRSDSSASSMFVKVNMEGYAVGRKIDLKAHQGYDSLSRALQKMFHNLLSANHSNMSKQDEDHQVVRSPNYVLLYEDNEGDKMLVGDVPWEMFISSVKRLYITMDQRRSQKTS